MTAAGRTTDPTREAVLAAMDRLLAGTPLRSSGRLSVSQLAIEAGIKRWHLTHQHLDLKELFAARVKAATADRQVSAHDLSDHNELKDKHAKLIKHCSELEERLQNYAWRDCSCTRPSAVRIAIQRFLN
jgi:hypothetical protein